MVIQLTIGNVTLCLKKSILCFIIIYVSFIVAVSIDCFDTLLWGQIIIVEFIFVLNKRRSNLIYLLIYSFVYVDWIGIRLLE